MKERILLVGEDPTLLVRAFLLAEWSTEIANAKGALPAMQAQPFDVVIIGQLVSVTRDEAADCRGPEVKSGHHRYS